MDMYCTQQSQKWVRKCKEWGAARFRLREALCMRWSWWCWLQSVTLKTATLSFFFAIYLPISISRHTGKVGFSGAAALAVLVLGAGCAGGETCEICWESTPVVPSGWSYSTCGNRPAIDPIQRGSMATSQIWSFNRGILHLSYCFLVLVCMSHVSMR